MAVWVSRRIDPGQTDSKNYYKSWRVKQEAKLGRKIAHSMIGISYLINFK